MKLANRNRLGLRLEYDGFNGWADDFVGTWYYLHAVGVDDDGDYRRVKARVWDTAGLERFKVNGPDYHEDVTGALLVYDIAK
ncbi:hypothetical protein DFH29DRAFT_901423 [Suillus ampliporus]|nr:hypothetical protein DFH29DRAFT_901423 [Suillus ampliporus]